MVYYKYMANRTRQNTYYGEDVIAIIRAEEERRHTAFSPTVNAIIREWHYWAELRRQQETKIKLPKEWKDK